MDTTTIQDVAKQTAELALCDAVLLAKGNMKTCQLRFEGQVLAIRLGQDLESTTVVFEPSVYGGTGEEYRKGVVFKIGEEDYEAFAVLEQWCRDELRATNPNVEALWCPSAKKSDKFGTQVKAKINLTGGAYGAKFYNEAKELCDAPEEWRGLQVSVILQVRGCYIQRNSVGLLIDVTHLQYKEAEQAQVCPF